MEKEFNRHHLIPSSKGGLTTHENIRKTEIKEHTRLHTWCGNDTPVEQLCRVLLFNEKIRTENFKADLLNILDNYINNYYVKHTHNWFIKSETQSVIDLENKL